MPEPLAPLPPPDAAPRAVPPLLAAVLDALPLPALALDAVGRVCHANAAAAAYRAELGETARGRDFFRELWPRLEAEGVGERYRARAGAALQVEVDAGAADDAPEAAARLYLRGLESDPAGGWGLVWIEERSALAAAEQRCRRAEHLAAVGEMAASVAHEVNNPLASIKSFAQLLAREATNEEQRRALELIVDEATRVARIVESLLSFARQQGARGIEPVDLNVIAERVLTLQRYSLQTAGIEVRRDLQSLLSSVMGEPGALEQVVLNLVLNAEQALSTRPDRRLLIVRTRESSDGVILSVVDNGPGIPRALLPEIFERFRTTKPHGSGLGLGISAAIVRDHAGQIWAESEEDRGAAFFVQLPRANAAPPTPRAPAPRRDSAASAPAASASAAAPAAAVAPAPLRVLLADDEPALRLAISLYLARRGHRVTQAADAHEALRLARENEFDVALVDARMPGDGLALLERLEALPSLQGRTALMTGDLGRVRATPGVATGRPYLSKPFDMESMLHLLETLGRRQP